MAVEVFASDALAPRAGSCPEGVELGPVAREGRHARDLVLDQLAKQEHLGVEPRFASLRGRSVQGSDVVIAGQDIEQALLIGATVGRCQPQVAGATTGRGAERRIVQRRFGVTVGSERRLARVARRSRSHAASVSSSLRCCSAIFSVMYGCISSSWCSFLGSLSPRPATSLRPCWLLGPDRRSMSVGGGWCQNVKAQMARDRTTQFSPDSGLSTALARLSLEPGSTTGRPIMSKVT